MKMVSLFFFGYMEGGRYYDDKWSEDQNLTQLVETPATAESSLRKETRSDISATFAFRQYHQGDTANKHIRILTMLFTDLSYDQLDAITDFVN